MKIKLFNFTRRNFNRNINYNPPIKNISKIPSNLPVKKQLTTGEKLVKITELIDKILCRIDKKNEEILAKLKKISEKQ